MTPPRPSDPDALFRAFEQHRTTCVGCDTAFLCPYGEHLMDAWMDADRYYANEQEMIDAVLTQDSERQGGVDA